MRFVLFVIWTAFVIWAEIALGNSWFGDRYHTGTDPKFKTSSDYHFFVDTDKSTVQAAGCDFFVLQKDGSDPIAGIRAEAPMGTNCDTYYVYGPKPIDGGTWKVEVGYPELHFHSDQTMSVKEMWNFEDAFFLRFLMWIVGILLWSMIGFGWILGFAD